jgi:hypothetical protein
MQHGTVITDPAGAEHTPAPADATIGTAFPEQSSGSTGSREEGTSVTVAPPRTATPRVRVQGMPVGSWLRTTPGRMRLASVLLLVGLLVVGVVAGTAARARGNAARDVGLESAPELVAAQNLYVALSDADATATTIFLTPGTEPADLRSRYLQDIDDAGRYLALVTRTIGTAPESHQAATTIAEQLPSYTARIDTARANLRQGFPVGQAYQRDGSALMRNTILPAATTLYERAARSLDDTYGSGTSTRELVFVIVAGVLLLALLVGVQIYVGRRTHRVLNPWLVAATVLVLIVLVWTVTRFSSEQDALVRAQRNGSDSMQIFSTARLLTLRLQSDDNLALVERGTGDAYISDFKTYRARLGGKDGTGGLLGDAAAIAPRTSTEGDVNALAQHFVGFTKAHDQVRTLDTNGNYDQAVTTSTETEAKAASALDDALGSQIEASRGRLDSAAADARSGFDALDVAIPLLAVLAAVLVLIGLQRRIGEYR